MAEKTNGKPMMVSKLRAKSLGNPKVAAGFSDEDMAAGKIHWLGTIMGKAGGVKPYKDPKDETLISYGLTGYFEGIPAEAGKPPLRSGVCWLPGGTHEMVVAQVESNAEAENGAVVEFAMRIGTRRDTNQAGYSYVTENIGEATAADPLADMRKALGEQLALPAPGTAAEAPKAAAGGRRRR